MNVEEFTGDWKINITFNSFDIGKLIFLEVTTDNYKQMIPLTYNAIKDDANILSGDLLFMDEIGYMDLQQNLFLLAQVQANKKVMVVASIPEDENEHSVIHLKEFSLEVVPF